MPWTRVDSRGIFTPGFTRRSSVATSPPLPKRTTATSTIRSERRSVPVVSRSNTASGRSPQSSKTGPRASRGRAASVTPGIMAQLASRRAAAASHVHEPPGAPGGPSQTRRAAWRTRRGRVRRPGDVVERVSEQRRAEVGEVDAQLVHPSGLGRQLDERRRAAVLNDAVGGLRLAARRVDGGPAGRRDRRDREDAPAREEVPRARGPVGRLERALQKLGLARPVFEELLRHDALARRRGRPA